MKKIVLIFLSLFLFSCGASIKSNFQSQLKPLTINDKVAFLEMQHIVPEAAIKIGDAKFGDTGFSTDCSFDSNLINARKLARQNGANIVKVIKKKTPDIISSCYRIDVEFYFYNGDVTNLPQYQIQIK